MSKTRILGISAYYHDSAAALVEDGKIIAAAQEERFTRIKADAEFPHHAIDYCLEAAGIDEHQLDYVVFYENPVVKFERLLTTYHLTAPKSWRSFLKAFPDWLTRKLWLESEIAKEMGIKKRIYFCDHHLSHAASAFFPSPFAEAAVLTIDGVGEWSTATFGIGRENQIQLLKEIRFPNSFGLLYSAFTYYTGFKINSGEYKLMGLAPYGEPKYADLIREKLIHLNSDGSIILNQHYFDYVGGLTMTNDRFHQLFGGSPRPPESLITQKEMDIAASIQVILNEAVLAIARYIHQQTQQENLCLAGGVALNVVAMGKLSCEGLFRQLWIQPAAGDAGGALGAALWFWHQKLSNIRTPIQPDAMQGAFLGTNIPPACELDDAMLERIEAVWQVHSEEVLQGLIAQKLAEGKVVAVARGRMEFGPRALGARSILADARSPYMQSHINLKIKFRESFRPFAPMVLAEDAAEYFEIQQESPYMLLAYPVKESRRLHAATKGLFGIDLLKVPRSDIPAVTHVDYSARIQTVDSDRNPFMHGILTQFKALTSCSVIVNTSFNVRSEPIVNTAEDAYRCFMATEIDYLVIGDRFFDRNTQKQQPLSDKERTQWLRRFELD
ncbi:MAG: carbamoyltransferase [Nostoc sp.]|uniref:carbamoyltransferase family protein n=1 Tax=Nostoc sp. TaxID=1180 RepID=UPI002FFAA281